MSDRFQEGQKVRATVTMMDDLVEHGLGSYVCAHIGEILVVRRVLGPNSYAVSHEHITDRDFTAKRHELEAV